MSVSDSLASPAVPLIDLGPTWSVVEQTRSELSVASTLVKEGLAAPVRTVLERTAAGVLASAYPSGLHDLRIVVEGARSNELELLLVAYASAFSIADPKCRRLLFCAAEGDLVAIAAAERAGFRFVVDIESREGACSVLVAEPGWVTRVDMDLDRVPGT